MGLVACAAVGLVRPVGLVVSEQKDVVGFWGGACGACGGACGVCSRCKVAWGLGFGALPGHAQITVSRVLVYSLPGIGSPMDTRRPLH